MLFSFAFARQLSSFDLRCRTVSSLYRSTARLHYSRTLGVLSYATLTSVISSIRRIQGAVAKHDAGPSKRFNLGIVRVIICEVTTVLLSLTYQPALLQTWRIVDNVEDVVLKDTMLKFNRALCENFSMASLFPAKSEVEEYT